MNALIADISRPDEVANALKHRTWDVVVEFIAFVPAEPERDITLFSGRTRHYVFISSASAYQKPLLHPVVTKLTPLKNPFWEYTRNKIACETRLMQEYRERETFLRRSSALR